MKWLATVVFGTLWIGAMSGVVASVFMADLGLLVFSGVLAYGCWQILDRWALNR